MVQGYETVEEAAKRLGKSKGRLWRILAEEPERIPGAVKPGRDWLIPVGAEITPKQYKMSEEKRAYYREKKREERARKKQAST